MIFHTEYRYFLLFSSFLFLHPGFLSVGSRGKVALRQRKRGTFGIARYALILTLIVVKKSFLLVRVVVVSMIGER